MKFCGMCGTRVERRMLERRGSGDEPRAVAIANAQLPSPDVAGKKITRVAVPAATEDIPAALPRRGEPAIFRNEPSNSGISGPSFLGLNNRPESNGSGDVEYLLEDEPSGHGLRKFILLLILAAIVGLVVVQWRSNFKANPKPAPAKADPSTPAPGPQGSERDPETTGKDYQVAAKNLADGVKAIAIATAAEPVAKAEPTALNTTDSDPSTTSDDVSSGKKTSPADAALPNSDNKSPEDARLPDYKPSAALIKAQQYIRGTGGVAQNCEQGILYLHAATEKSDPGAAIQMGALYSSGICVKQDRVMAYRWFNSAHELQPANMWIQKNMDQLWAQMSSQERRLAGY